MRAIIRGGAERAQEVRQAGRAISGMVQTARVVVGDTAYAIVTPVEQVFPDSAPTEAAPQVVASPAIPAGTIGQVVTLDYGTASGLPAPTATAVLTRDGTPVAIPGNRQITLAAGAYVLTVTWANGVGTPAVGTASRTITATPAVSMTTPPTAAPLSATVGDTVTLGLGTYQNAVSVVGVLMQGGVDRTAQITDGVWSPAVSGAFTWTVTATGASGPPIVNTVSGTIAAAPVTPSVNYALADGYFNEASVISGTNAAVTGATNAGNGGWNLASTGTGAEVTKSAAGFGFTAGKRLSATSITRTNLDGVFIMVRATLAAYGGSGSYIFTANPTGGLISIYDNNGTLQARYHDGTTRNISLGATPYGTEFVVGLEIDNAGNRVRVRNLAGEIVEATPAAVPGVLFNTVNMGQVVNGTVHEVAIFTRPTGGAFASTFAAVAADFLAA